MAPPARACPSGATLLVVGLAAAAAADSQSCGSSSAVDGEHLLFQSGSAISRAELLSRTAVKSWVKLKRLAHLEEDRAMNYTLEREAEAVRRAAVSWTPRGGFHYPVPREEAMVNDVLSRAGDMLSPDEAAKRGVAISEDDISALVGHGNYAERLCDGCLEGDIAPGPEEHEAPLQHAQGAAGTWRHAAAVWTGGRVVYCFDEHIDSRARAAFQRAMEIIRWRAPGCFNFSQVSYAGPGRCSERPAIFMKSRRPGCFSHLGMVKHPPGGGNQVVNLQPVGCTQVGTATHEVLHALGMTHEQSRPDRDEFVAVRWRNVQQSMAPNFRMELMADTVHPYDVGSLMHYGSSGFSANGQPTLQKRPGVSGQMGQRVGMSLADVHRLRRAYSCEVSESGTRRGRWWWLLVMSLPSIHSLGGA